ncbi:MAG TPA: Gfo/Idh/MocA family oxidoreductase [Gemmataceae bacterium]|jgi:predicted dehydrogenase|nr:Gfo/Idh/MocA family oxidoreductase [Gemmataceae bacterium]
MKHRTNRRDFLKQTSIAGVGFWVAGGSAIPQSRAANDKINFACIGVGGKGSGDTEQAGHYGNMVALCDIDEKHLEAKAKDFPSAKKYTDFRKMFDEMGKEIDAVTVSTPDHTHAVASIMAMKLGKHVYCQKPLTHTVYEARMMRETAAKMKVATQMGNQGTAENGLRQACEVIRSGAIGPVREVHVWTNRPIWPQAPAIMARPKDTVPAPPHVHWDSFLGPAPERPYAVFNGKPAYHPFAWRGWWDFGTGALGDMACHTANMAFMALKLGYPTGVFAECGDLNPETYPSWATVNLDFPGREEMPPVKFFWYEGKRSGKKNLPPLDLLKGENPSGSGSLLVGDKGTLYSPNDYGAQYKLLPEKDFAGYKVPEPSLPRNGKGDDGMKGEWVAAIKGGPPAMSNFDYAAMLTETILLGNIAIRCQGKKLQWDGPSLKFTNSSEANNYIKTEYRKGWTL